VGEILYLSTLDARVQDLFYFPFHVILKLHRRRGWLSSARERVLPMGFEERYMEYRMDAHLRR